MTTWRRSDVDLGQLWQAPDGTVYRVLSIADDPTVELEPIRGDFDEGVSAVEHHVIVSRNFAEWRRLLPIGPADEGWQRGL